MRSQLSLRDWINDADAALYRAKHAGRNQVAGSSAPMPPGIPTPPQPA